MAEMIAGGEQDGARVPTNRPALLRPAGLAYLAWCLAALAIGVWPRGVFVPHRTVAAPLPALKALAAGQVLFALVAWPVIVVRRRERRASASPAFRAVEMGVWLLLAGPLYVAAGYLADATAADGVRAAVHVACVWSFALASAAWLADGGAARPVTLAVLLLAALGLPAAHYIALEFATPAAAEFLDKLSPATSAWRSAAAGGAWWPQPLWPTAVWPVLALGASLARLLGAKRSRP